MKIIFDVDKADFKVYFEYESEEQLMMETPVYLYHMIPPTSPLFDYLIKALADDHPQLYKRFINMLKSEEPVVAPESIL